MKNHSTHSIDKLFWGVFFVAGAALLILSKLGTLPDLSFISICLLYTSDAADEL